nr:hypothetical protein [Tanacetum cinerariifolium]
MLHICPRIPGKSFDELPFEADILEFLRFLGHSAQIRTLTDAISSSNLVGIISQQKHRLCISDLGRATRCITPDSLRDDNIFSTIKVVSRHQNTQQYGVILLIELTNEDIRNTKAYKEYYAYASGEVAPKPKASARRKRGGSDSSTTPPTTVASPRPTIAATPKLIAAAKGKQPAKAKSPSDPSYSGIDEGTGSKPGVSDVPSDDLEEEISWVNEFL